MAGMRDEMLEEARRGVHAAYVERDRLLTHTVGTIGDLDKTANLLYERLAEWYGIYFPELKVAEPDKYCKIVLMFDRKSMERNTLAEIVGEQKAGEIILKAQRSLGADFGAEEMRQVRALAQEIVGMYALREGIEEYQAKVAKEIAPNLCHLVEPMLAARLIAQAGSLKRLATMPASTVQVLGAEKALFKHLRTGTLPPKYGLIFQHPMIGNAPMSHRGKLARALATKLAIAAKADAYSHNFIADKLKATFERRAKDIALLPVREKKPPQRPQWQGRPQFQGRPQGGQGRSQFQGSPGQGRPSQGQGRPQEWQGNRFNKPRWKRR